MSISDPLADIALHHPTELVVLLTEIYLRPRAVRRRFLGSVAVLPPIMAAPMVASSDALQECKCV